MQFAPLAPATRAEPPGWLTRLGEWLEALFRPLGQFLAQFGFSLKWLVLALAAFALVALLWRLREPIAAWLGRAPRDTPAAPDWRPDSSEALALLEDADRLAAEGRYDEATHVLLKRSVGQIAAARPGLLDPSSTAREIATLAALSDPARHAFGVIAERVERSLFALRRLNADDWYAARAAYAEFALTTPALRTA
ncbi:MAG: hypothetical protein B7Z08_03135 [Sphingomonadales bacterium 32-68-7]|nr:MAG: hypothetical protein B7Z33_07805 [Sphingomonadales bacterium 12-68-11]OYX09949.1 MAG: hypothetical protein B7Z08_03135 [Sphingomonadales bacterium 32-68-7]